MICASPWIEPRTSIPSNRAATNCMMIFPGQKNDGGLMLYLTTKYVFENFEVSCCPLRCDFAFWQHTCTALALIVANVVLLNFFLYFCSKHAQHLSQWRSCTIGGSQSLRLFMNLATCLKKLRMPGSFIPRDQTKMLRAVMAAYVRCRCKHWCLLIFRVVAYLHL